MIKKVSDSDFPCYAYSYNCLALTPGGSCRGKVYFMIGYNFGSNGTPVLAETNRPGFLIET